MNESPVAALPDTVAAIAESIARFQGQLLGHSLLSASGQRLRPAWMLATTMKLKLRVYLTRSSQQTKFLFRKRIRTEVVLDTDLAVELRPRFRDEGAASPAPTYAMAGIPFVREGLPAARLRELASPEATAANTIVFSLDQDGLNLLVVVNPADKDKRQVFHWSRGRKEPLSSQNKQWPLLPFWELMEAIRAWIALGIDNTPAVPVPDLVVEESSIQEIVDSAKRCYMRLRAPLDPDSGPLSPALSDFRFRVLLRVDPNGRVSEKGESDPFQIRFSLREVSTASSGELRFSVGPPDFLVSGPLLAAFRNVLVGVKATLRQNLWFRIQKEKGALAPSRGEFMEFIQSAFQRGNASVFRIRRQYRDLKEFNDLDESLRESFERDPLNIDFEEGKKRVVISVDTDIFALRGTDRGLETILIFSAPFRVVPSLGEKGVDVLIKQGKDLKILYFGAPLGGMVDEDFAEYFFRLAANLKTWTRLL